MSPSYWIAFDGELRVQNHFNDTHVDLVILPSTHLRRKEQLVTYGLGVLVPFRIHELLRFDYY